MVPPPSFDSIYKNKVAYLILSIVDNGDKQCMILTHNTDLLRVLDTQIAGCFSLYILSNGSRSANGFFPVSPGEKNMLLYIPSIMKCLRDELEAADILDEEMYLISIAPFVRGIAKMNGYDRSFRRLSSIMHGTLTKSVNIASAYRWIITRQLKRERGKVSCKGYVPNRRMMLTADRAIDRLHNWQVSGCQDILNPDKYGLLNKALKHTASFLYLRMSAEKVLCQKFSINGTDMKFGDICTKAMNKAKTMYGSHSSEIEKWRAGLMSKKSLVNEFNHFEGSLSIFFPAIDVSDEVLRRETDSIEAILKGLESLS